MLTTCDSLIYHDSSPLENGDLRITPENSCDILFSSIPLFHINTTEIMDQFITDKKTYMVFNFGFYNDDSLYVVAKYEPSRYASNIAPSISMIKSAAIDELWFHEDNNTLSVQVPHERLRPLLHAIVNTLPVNNAHGLYTIQSEDLILFKAQSSDDRNGFRKIWINGELIEEKNYGDCSMAFSAVAVYVG